ncbi:MAG TPA: hypothetical protein DHW82_13500, partial [Spirochaetia bacterium]|nr:hypothetical protein [Spirochaetia bacterium]
METSLFNHSPQKSLAELLRPKNLDEFTGQEEILGPGKTLRTLIEKDKITSLIFYGPPGTGKTTLARIVSQMTQSDFVEVNATDSSVKEIREVCKKAGEKRRIYNKKTILFIDEVHRFNKAQQDVLLPFLEQREVIFIGSTTFNPFFYITPALNSRTLLFEFKKLEEKHLKKVLQRAFEGKVFQLSEEAENYLISISNGDARVLLNRLEILFSLKEDEQTIEKEELKE